MKDLEWGGEVPRDHRPNQDGDSAKSDTTTVAHLQVDEGTATAGLSDDAVARWFHDTAELVRAGAVQRLPPPSASVADGAAGSGVAAPPQRGANDADDPSLPAMPAPAENGCVEPEGLQDAPCSAQRWLDSLSPSRLASDAAARMRDKVGSIISRSGSRVGGQAC